MVLDFNLGGCVVMAVNEKDNEHYLTDEQLEYFRGKLLNWKMELLREAGEARAMFVEMVAEPDVIDSACNTMIQTVDLRTKDRARKLIHKIDDAISRIDSGIYGYCEETGNPIGLKRLEARPVATLCIEAQERREKMEKDYREDALDG
ncbi:MAG: RNA polymerase-binding protein DksA [Holosporales bacterium]|jgi:DnaK suppressor protein|nr:RNA polymerase-binding protein DksA [Holosporales bacterium]